MYVFSDYRIWMGFVSVYCHPDSVRYAWNPRQNSGVDHLCQYHKGNWFPASRWHYYHSPNVSRPCMRCIGAMPFFKLWGHFQKFEVSPFF